jgi:hypothetical protein
VKGYLAQDTLSIPHVGDMDEFFIIGGTDASGDLFTDLDFPSHGAIGFGYSSFSNSHSIVNQLLKRVYFA